MEQPWAVLGLGNPGDRYRATRHNIGFRVVERLSQRGIVRCCAEGTLSEWVWIAERFGGPQRFLLAKSRSYMNRCGRAAVELQQRYRIATRQMLIVYDDADLELGKIRIRSGGSAGGHNGIRSLIESLGSDGFPRVKLGVRGAGRPEVGLADYVLEPFEPEEEPLVETLTDRAADAVECIVGQGLVGAMNRFNGRVVETEGKSEL